jgi:hypothetical protein
MLKAPFLLGFGYTENKFSNSSLTDVQTFTITFVVAVYEQPIDDIV